MTCVRMVLVGIVCLLLAGAGPALPLKLSVMMGLGEIEWRTMRERIFPPFEQQYGVTIRSIQAEAADAVKKLIAMHRAGRMQVDLIAQDILLLQPLVDAGMMADLSAYQHEIPPTALPQLIDVGTFNGVLYFMPYRPNVQIAYYHAPKFAAYGLQPPRTWDELLAVAQRFKTEEGVGRVLLHGTLDLNTTTHVVEFIWAAGGNPLVLNDPGACRHSPFSNGLPRRWRPRRGGPIGIPPIASLAPSRYIWHAIGHSVYTSSCSKRGKRRSRRTLVGGDQCRRPMSWAARCSASPRALRIGIWRSISCGI